METWVNVFQDHATVLLQKIADCLKRALAFIHIAEHDLAIEGDTLIADKRFASLNNQSLCPLGVALDNARTGDSILRRPSIQSLRLDFTGT
jgi:hypothetical protein